MELPESVPLLLVAIEDLHADVLAELCAVKNPCKVMNLFYKRLQHLVMLTVLFVSNNGVVHVLKVANCHKPHQLLHKVVIGP